MSSCVSSMIIFGTNTWLFYKQNKRNYNGKCLSWILLIHYHNYYQQRGCKPALRNHVRRACGRQISKEHNFPYVYIEFCRKQECILTSFVAFWMRSEGKFSPSWQCSSWPIGFGQGFLSREQCDNTGASPILSLPRSSWYLTVFFNP